MTYLPPVIYWCLVVCWLAILIFYARQYIRFKRIFPLLTTLLIVLFIDASRTLIESIYFGIRYTARAGLFPSFLYEVLDAPQYISIPKGLNLIAALIIIMVIIRRWFDNVEEVQQRRSAAEELQAELISLASHELRSPLTSIQGYAQTLIREYGRLGTETQLEFLEGISNEAQRLNHLVSDLLDISQIDEGRLRLERHSVSPEQLCQTAVRSIDYPGVARNFRVEIQPDLPEVFADPIRINQVLVNLLSNAIKFSTEGSDITVSARRRGDLVEFGVIDQGVGIPREEQNKLFTRFHRASNSHGAARPGAGLGLYISKALVEAHAGSMSFHSELGTGSTFFFTLPTVAKIVTNETKQGIRM